MQVVCTQEMDVANNKSTIHWTLSSIGGEVNYYSTGPTSVYINAKCVYYKDRVSAEAKTFPAAKGSVSGTIEIDHKEDGTKGTTVLMNTVVYYGSSSVKEYSGWWVLDPIPRTASILTAPSSFTNATPPTITYDNPRGNDIKSLDVCIADADGWYEIVPYRSVNKTGTLSYTFTSEDMKTLNNAVGELGSTAKSLNVMFVVRTTTTDGAEHGDGTPSTYKMVETSDTKPNVTMTLAVSNPSTYPSALASTYIHGKSGVKATITGKEKYGATISSYALNVGGVTKSSTSNIITSDAISTSGTVSVVGSATDSRGFTGSTASTSITVLAYSKPLVIPLGSENAIQCYRSDSSGVRKGSSTSVRIKAKRSYYGLNGNNKCKLQWRRKLASETWNDSSHTWADLIARTTTSTDEYNANLSVTFELTKAYSVQIRAIDDLGEFDRKDFDIPTQEVALHLGKGGKNVSIGEFCDTSVANTFSSSWKAIFKNGITGTLTGNVTGNLTGNVSGNLTGGVTGDVKGNVTGNLKGNVTGDVTGNITGTHNGTTSSSLASDVKSFATSCPNGFTPFITGGSTTNVPATGNFDYASGFVHKRSNEQITVFIISYYTGDLAINTYYKDGGGWLGWRYLHTTTT